LLFFSSFFKETFEACRLDAVSLTKPTLAEVKSVDLVIMTTDSLGVKDVESWSTYDEVA